MITKKAMLAAVLRAQDEEAEGLQKLIEDGTWGLEGSTGRAMMRDIEAGICVLGDAPARDYWGIRIPSRHEVKAGTKGSVQYAYAALKRREAGE
jgi:hypothetical protein